MVWPHFFFFVSYSRSQLSRICSHTDPLFWLHHALVDKIWYDWQNIHPSNKKALFGGAVQAIQNATGYYYKYPTGAPPFLQMNATMPSDAPFPAAMIQDVMSTTEGILCYVYE
ncbi:tyrosinase [Favolaschia claudopus]|uniref:Tyrosinase n=1 Tax=Favolaschia claudopus TaxID=2862362 RepID=A0AAW0D5P8_9AGAR